MTFGALGGWVVAAIAAGVAAAVTALFFMKVRHPRVLVPSLLLWRRVLDEDRQVSFWERVRKAVSYALAVLVPLLVVLALGRPERNSAGSGGVWRRRYAGGRCTGRATAPGAALRSGSPSCAPTWAAARSWSSPRSTGSCSRSFSRGTEHR